MKHKLEIIFDDETGKTFFSGPLNNKVLCYGMMELAKQAMARDSFKPLDVKPESMQDSKPEPAGATH